jgi:hypothetical protein
MRYAVLDGFCACCMLAGGLPSAVSLLARLLT